ncbi:MAG: lysostaphin resistance A-like protein [Faecalibacterium sp.]
MKKECCRPLRGMPGAAAGCGCVLVWLVMGLALDAAGAALPAAEGLVWGLRLVRTCLCAVPPLLLARGLGLSGRELGFCCPGRGGSVSICLALIAACLGAALLPGEEQALPQGRAALGLAFLALCPAAALCEEAVFRGAAQSCFAASELGGPWLAVCAQAMLFAGLHSGPAGMLYALEMGLILGWLRQRTGSVWPGAVLHLLNNAAVFIGLL